MFGSLFGKKAYRDISPQEARNRLASGQNILLLDVRSPEEYAEVHIPHSVSVPLDRLQSQISKVANDKDMEIIVYCLSGARAASACSLLTAMGYTNVSSMGGIRSWAYETERGTRSR